MPHYRMTVDFYHFTRPENLEMLEDRLADTLTGNEGLYCLEELQVKSLDEEPTTTKDENN